MSSIEASYSIHDLPGRIAEKIAVDPAGCWIWTAGTVSDGYGSSRWNGRMARAHRVTFHLLADNSLAVFPGCGGDRVTLDHVCRVRRCVNPAHLEVVSNRENILRGCVEANGSSGYVGVGRHQRKWLARIWSDGRNVYLGYFAEEVDAAHAYDAACIALGVSVANLSRGLVDRPPTEAEIAEARRRLDRADDGEERQEVPA